MHVCCSAKPKRKKILSEVPINTRLTQQERLHYATLFETHAENVNGKRVVKSHNFPELLGLFGTDIAQKFAERIFKYIANNHEYIDQAQYFTYLDLYHHGDVKERCRITFKLMTDSTKGDIVFKRNFIDYLNLILNAIKKVHPSAAENMLTEKEMEILFKKISKNREFFTLEDFENMYNKKPELLSWIDYFKNNDEDILFSMDNNIKKLLQESQNFFASFYKNLVKNDFFDMLKADKFLGDIISDIESFCKKLNREIKKINIKHSIDLKRILENPNAKDFSGDKVKREGSISNYQNVAGTSSFNLNAAAAKNSKSLFEKAGVNNDFYVNQLVNSTRNKTEMDKLNPSSNVSNVMELQNFNGQIPKFNLNNSDLADKENEILNTLDGECGLDVNNIIERFKYVKVVLYENQGEGIPEEDEYDYDNESIHTPNISISAIKNPNNNTFNDSNCKILVNNDPKIEKLNFNKSAENMVSNINNINNEVNPNVNFNYEKNYLVAALAQKKGSSPNNNSKAVEKQTQSGLQNPEKGKLISKENPEDSHRKFNSDRDKAEISARNRKSLKLALELSKKAKSEQLNGNCSMTSNDLNAKVAENSISVEKLMEEDIILSEINENLRTPNANLKHISNHFLAKYKENAPGVEKNCIVEAAELQRFTFKFNDNQEKNASKKSRKTKSESSLAKYNSKNEPSGKSNSVSLYNSNENSQNLLCGNKKPNNVFASSNNNTFNGSKAEDSENINFKKKRDAQKIFDSGNTLKDKHSNENNQHSKVLNNSNNNVNNHNQNNNNNIKPVYKTTSYFDSTGSDVHFEYKPNKNFNGNFDNSSDLKGFNSAGIESANFKRVKSSSENIGSVRSKTADPYKDEVGVGSRRKTSMRQRETIIFNQEDIFDYLHFKEWRKKMKLFFDKLKDLVVNLSSCLNTIDQSYSWIQKRFLKDNLKRIKKSHKLRTENENRISINKKPNKPKLNLNTNLKASDKNFKLLLNMIMGIQLAVQQNPYIEINIGDKYDNYIRSNIYSIQTTGFDSYNLETYYIKEFAGIIFERIRRMFNIDKEEFIASISPQEFITEMMISSTTIIEELCSTGKSGSLFYYTRDGRYIIKSIRKSEYHCLKRIFKNYFEHLLTNPYTLLPVFFGCFKLVKKIKKAKTKIYFIIMQNIFSTPNEIHLRYDLKGSRIGRAVFGPNIKKMTNLGMESYAMKDIDLERERRYFNTGEKRNLILRQIESDTIFLKKCNIIDYSLLVGVHIPEIRKSERVFEPKREENKLKIERLDSQENNYFNNNYTNKENKENIAMSSIKMRKSVTSKAESVKLRDKRFELFDDADKYDENSLNNKDFESEISHYEKNINCSDSNPNINFCEGVSKHAFKEIDGGIKSVCNSEIYYLGIIDILTDYNCLKRVEYVSKMIFYCSKKMSCVPPDQYQNRFLDYMTQRIAINPEESENLKKSLKKK